MIMNDPLSFERQLKKAVEIFEKASFGEPPPFVSIPYTYMQHLMFLLEKYVPEEELKKPWPAEVKT